MNLKTIHDVDDKILKSFTCGNHDLDSFLRKYARDNDQNGYGKTFLLEDKDEIVGFFTLCSSSIKFEEFPVNNSQHLPRYPIPCIKIARLAVCKSKQGKGYGRELLKQAFLRILNASTTVGVRFVIVDAKESSASFYEKYGFARLIGDKLSYYLLLDTIKEAFKD